MRRHQAFALAPVTPRWMIRYPGGTWTLPSGARRGAGLNEERDQTLNQILVEMDGFNKPRGVLVLAATNRAEALDPALLRPGRLTRRVFVGPPNLAGRAQILVGRGAG